MNVGFKDENLAIDFQDLSNHGGRVNNSYEEDTGGRGREERGTRMTHERFSLAAKIQ